MHSAPPVPSTNVPFAIFLSAFLASAIASAAFSCSMLNFLHFDEFFSFPPPRRKVDWPLVSSAKLPDDLSNFIGDVDGPDVGGYLCLKIFVGNRLAERRRKDVNHRTCSGCHVPPDCTDASIHSTSSVPRDVV